MTGCEASAQLSRDLLLSIMHLVRGPFWWIVLVGGFSVSLSGIEHLNTSTVDTNKLTISL